jgi:hypothetical protein
MVLHYCGELFGVTLESHPLPECNTQTLAVNASLFCDAKYSLVFITILISSCSSQIITIEKAAQSCSARPIDLACDTRQLFVTRAECL